MALTDLQSERYARQLMLEEVGAEGQQRLLRAKVCLVGAGGLGSVAGYYLAAAGVGTIALIDDDKVELSNLHRQIAHRTASIGTPKVRSARESFIALNPDVRVVPIETRLTKENALGLLKFYDVVLDCTDNFPSRFLINDACFTFGKPLVIGAVLGHEGQATTVLPSQGHCYRCLFEGPPPPDAVPPASQSGLLGVLPGVMGVVQATEAIKILLGIGEPLTNRLLIYNALSMEFRTIPVPRNPDCPLCGESPRVEGLGDPVTPML